MMRVTRQTINAWASMIRLGRLLRGRGPVVKLACVAHLGIEKSWASMVLLLNWLELASCYAHVTFMLIRWVVHWPLQSLGWHSLWLLINNLVLTWPSDRLFMLQDCPGHDFFFHHYFIPGDVIVGACSLNRESSTQIIRLLSKKWLCEEGALRLRRVKWPALNLRRALLNLFLTLLD